MPLSLELQQLAALLYLHCCKLFLGSSDLLFTELADGFVRATAHCSIASVDDAIAYVVECRLVLLNIFDFARKIRTEGV